MEGGIKWTYRTRDNPTNRATQRRSIAWLNSVTIGPAWVHSIVRRRDSLIALSPSDAAMKVLLLMIAWCVLLALSWPIALIALIAVPIVWLLSLPLRLIGLCVESILALLRAVLLLPARVLGHRG
jgi:hypothetical protein